MPILWRYLVSYFLKIVFACVLAFVTILLTMRLDEIAHFAALGAPLSSLLIFVFHQIPYILPIALPISCLIGSLILIQRLSNTHELTALRACGFSLLNILSPILLTAAFLALGNFWVASDLSTQSHLQTSLLKSELRSINPLLLLHNKHLMRLKGFYFEALGDAHVGESSSDVVLTIPNNDQQRLNLMLAKNLQAVPSLFTGKGVTLITGAASEQEDDFDHLVIENMHQSVTQVQDFSNFLQKKVLTINNDYLQMPLLILRIQEQKNQNQVKLLNESLSEIAKRFSIGIAVFSFTLMGASFGINISRKRQRRPLFFAIILTLIYLVSFFLAKSFEYRLEVAAPLYLVPHIIIITASILYLSLTTKGIE